MQPCNEKEDSVKVQKWTLTMCVQLLMVLALLVLTPRSSAAVEIAIFGGPSVYDLASIGAAFSTSLRVTQPLAPWARVEAAVALAFPKPRDESRYVLCQPEIGLLLTWPRKGWTPYIGAAAGAAGFGVWNDDPDWEFALSGAVGAIVPIGRRLSLRPEFRIRGIGSALSASISDFGVGLALKL